MEGDKTNFKKNNWLLYLLILLVCSLGYYGSNRFIQRNEAEISAIELKDAHNRSKQIVYNSVNVFAAIASGLQAYTNSAETLPTARELQHFVNQQLTQVNYDAPIVVSFIDTSHTFIYSFTRDSINPYNIVGTSVASLRNTTQIKQLNELFKTEALKIFPPLNLLEGWVGIPINFRVRREGITLGYIAAIVQFKSLANSLYTSELSNTFIHKFSINDIPFDREQVYDGSTKYHTAIDPKSYKNFELDSSDFMYSKLALYGQELTIGTGRNTNNKNYTNKISQIILALFFLNLAIFSFILLRLFRRQKHLVNITKESNERLRVNQSVINQQNAQLVKLNATKDRFFSIIAHDLRGPLGSLSGLIELIQEDESLEPGLKGLMGQLQDATKSTTDLLDSLLKWSMSQTGDIPFTPEKLDLKNTLASTVGLVQSMATNKEIKIENLVDDNVVVYADKNMLSTVVRNLISNAIKFTHKKGKIKIYAKANEANTFIYIEDSGIGMSQTQVDALFAMENHKNSKGTSGEMGTGLGLIVSKEFIDKHNGKLTVESTVDVGTTFIISIPNTAT